MRKQKMNVLIGSILISIVLLLFYIPPFFADTRTAEVSIETVSGDEEVMASVALRGVHHVENRGSMLEVSLDGTEYLAEESTMSNYLNQDLFVKELREQYPAFMRGKAGYTSNYLEDEQYLYYLADYVTSGNSSSPSVPFTIERLDKQTEQIESREIEISGFDSVYNVLVRGYQVRGNVISLHLLLETEDEEQNWQHHEVVYVYDWLQEEVLSQVDLLSTADSNTMEENSTMWAGVTLSGGEQPQLLVQRIDYPYNETQEGNFSESGELSLWLYDVASSQMKELNIPDELLESGWQFVIDEDFLYFVQADSDKVHVRIFDVGTEQVIEEVTQTISSELFPIQEDGMPILMDLDSDYLFFGQLELSQTAPSKGMTLIEKASGTVVYEGRMKMEARDDSVLHSRFIFFREIIRRE